MARLHVAFLLLIVAISVVIVSAADKPPSTTTASAPAATTPGDGSEGDVPVDDNTIGTTDDDAAPAPSDDASGDEEVAVAGPIGSDSSYANYPPPEKTSESGANVASSFGLVVAAMVGSFFFF
ncbi:PREDICTED: anther-specific protein BCP1-like [Camelina sativa]|uniref:Anther-specific protein BCP1-like n=1 Tax=Camelina sativa TaxID=90675 RepID=A0ABM0TEQ9_CAMSA|nr:PREDICTED: anther-specific protein BCP1-like [Camelina sativa]